MFSAKAIANLLAKESWSHSETHSTHWKARQVLTAQAVLALAEPKAGQPE
jgi:hypothetical protein